MAAVSETPTCMRLRDVSPDGSCFFRSVYRSALQHGVADFLVQCLGDSREACRSVRSENEFVGCVRAALAEKVRRGEDAGMVRIFLDWLDSLRISAGSLSTLGDYGFPVSYALYLEPAFKPASQSQAELERKVRSAMADHLENRRNYVGELEVNLVRNLIEKCTEPTGLPIEVVVWTREEWNRRTKTVPPPLRSGSTIKLYLVNLDEAHYNWVEFSAAACDSQALGTTRGPAPLASKRIRSPSPTRKVVRPAVVTSRGRSPARKASSSFSPRLGRSKSPVRSKPAAVQSAAVFPAGGEPVGCEKVLQGREVTSTTDVGEGWFVVRARRITSDKLDKYWCRGDRAYDRWDLVAKLKLSPALRQKLLRA